MCIDYVHVYWLIGKANEHIFVPRLSRKRGILKLIRPSVCPSVCQSLCHKNFNLAHIFWSINDRALIFGMHDPCDKPFLLIPCSDPDLDLWPTPRSNLLPGGGPQFFEFACTILWETIIRLRKCKYMHKLTQTSNWLMRTRYITAFFATEGWSMIYGFPGVSSLNIIPTCVC